MKEREGRRLIRRVIQGAAGGSWDLRELPARLCQPEGGEGLTATCQKFDSVLKVFNILIRPVSS